jgi:hypothetical protein
VPAHAIPQYVTNQTHSQNAGALSTYQSRSAVRAEPAGLLWVRLTIEAGLTATVIREDR